MRVGRRRGEDEGTGAGSNVAMVMYSSLMLILLTFFIMLSRGANFDDTKLGQALGSLEDAFGILSGGQSLDSLSDGNPYDGVGEIKRELALIRQLLAPMLSEEQARFSFRGQTYTVSLAADYLFEAEDPVVLRAEARLLLRALANLTHDVPAPIIIEAHTDDQPSAVPGFEDNWRLSSNQALTVLSFLISEGGLDERLLSAYSYAGYRPVVTNNSPLNRFRNRRVNLVLDFSRSAAARRILGSRGWIDIEGLNFSTDDSGGRGRRP